MFKLILDGAFIIFPGLLGNCFLAALALFLHFVLSLRIFWVICSISFVNLCMGSFYSVSLWIFVVVVTFLSSLTVSSCLIILIVSVVSYTYLCHFDYPELLYVLLSSLPGKSKVVSRSSLLCFCLGALLSRICQDRGEIFQRYCSSH